MYAPLSLKWSRMVLEWLQKRPTVGPNGPKGPQWFQRSQRAPRVPKAAIKYLLGPYFGKEIIFFNVFLIVFHTTRTRRSSTKNIVIYIIFDNHPFWLLIKFFLRANLARSRPSLVDTTTTSRRCGGASQSVRERNWCARFPPE